MGLSLLSLVLWWRQRLGAMQEAAAGDARDWLVAVRVRVLRFLIARYGERASGEPTEQPIDPTIPPFVREPEHVREARRGRIPDYLLAPRPANPPRPAVRLGALLSDIREQNATGRRRWSWFRWR